MPPTRRNPKPSSKAQGRSPSQGSSHTAGQSSHSEEAESDGDNKTKLQIKALAAQLKKSVCVPDRISIKERNADPPIQSKARREAKRKAQEKAFAKKSTKLSEKIEGIFEKLREAEYCFFFSLLAKVACNVEC